MNPTNPADVIDRDGDVWTCGPDGLYRMPRRSGRALGHGANLRTLTARYGPLTEITESESPMSSSTSALTVGSVYTSTTPPPAGTHLRDKDGDVWEVREDGRVDCVESTTGVADMRMRFYDLFEYDPLTVVRVVGSAPDTPALEGDQYRDRDGDVWRVQRDGMLRCLTGGYTYHTTQGGCTLEATRSMCGPLERIPDSEHREYEPDVPVGAAYRDSEDDIWYRCVRGWSMSEEAAQRPDYRGGETFASIDRDFGPLKREPGEDLDMSAPLPEGARVGTFAGEDAQPDSRTTAYTRARTLVTATRREGIPATADDVLKLARFLLGV